jgi:hypothetical protein
VTVYEKSTIIWFVVGFGRSTHVPNGRRGVRWRNLRQKVPSSNPKRSPGQVTATDLKEGLFVDLNTV